MVYPVQVTAGTVNYEGPITIKATSTGTDSTLAGIGRLVADAQAREAPVQRLADAVAGRFVPCIWFCFPRVKAGLV